MVRARDFRGIDKSGFSWYTRDNIYLKGYDMNIQGSMRERYILAQALTVAIQELEKVEPPVMREVSNIEDMKDLLSNDALKPFNEIMVSELPRHWEPLNGRVDKS